MELNPRFVTPLAGVWIEILYQIGGNDIDLLSLPLRECGLKLLFCNNGNRLLLSLPLRECGLKSFKDRIYQRSINVTPLAGVWIEIITMKDYHPPKYVTPLAGVWIEIMDQGLRISDLLSSLPLRECGLKFEEMINCFKIMGRLWRCYLKGF